jgi:DNA-binding LacI/PurR family transcriptional regulator
MADEGLVRREQGRGTFVTFHAAQQSMRRVNVFALIAPRLLEDPYPALIHGFEEEGAALHHQIQVGNSKNDIGRQAHLILGLIDQMVSGVAIVPTTAEPTPAFQIRQLQKNQIPVVFCHRTVEGVAAPCVSFSGYDVGFMAGQMLVKSGHRRVACLLDRRTSLANEYERGLTDAMRRSTPSDTGSVVTIEYGFSNGGEQTRDAIRAAVAPLMAARDRPTGLFCGNVTDGEQVYLQLDAAGFKAPRDLSIVAFGGPRLGHGLSQRISGPIVDEKAVGSRAAEVLQEMQRGQRPIESDELIEFPITFYQGETLGPAK